MALQNWRRIAALLLMPVWLCACTAAPAAGSTSALPPEETPPPEVVDTAQPQSAAEELLGEMTLRQKVGQLFMVRPDALDPSLTREQINDDKAEGVTSLTDAMEQRLQAYPVGGICQFGKNITDPQQITRFNEELQAASQVPLLLAVDEEGGSVARLANNPAFDLPRYESAAAVGQTGDPEAAREMGRTIGAYLREYGFNMDFAPVADVYTNPDNTVIGTRAFSRQGDEAAVMAGAMAQGLQEEAILPTLKHFPGHGDTAQDSHSGLAYTQRSKEQMLQCEFLPFMLPTDGVEGIGLHAVMVGHIAAPSLGSGDVPASLSYPVVTELLRQELLAGQDVLVVTDSLAMKAITDTYSPGQAAVQAFLAGCEVLLMPDSLTEAFDAVVAAVEDGTISQERLEESVARILRFKEHYAGL